jgi:hypothetical protein
VEKCHQTGNFTPFIHKHQTGAGIKMNCSSKSTNGTNLLILAVVGFATLLVGCSAVMHSRKIDPNEQIAPGTIPKDRQGIAYFLPMAKIHILAVKTNWYETNIFIHTGYRPIDANDPDKGNYPTQILANVVSFKTNYIFTIEQVIGPDYRQIYSLKLNHSMFADDNYGIMVNPNGFLTSINATNSDQSGEVIKTLAKTGISIAELVLTGGTVPPGIAKNARAFGVEATNLCTVTNLPEMVDITFDPLDKTAMGNANNQLQGIAFVSILDSESKKEWNENSNDGIATNHGGFFYRPALPYELALENRPGTIKIQRTIYLPNQAPILNYNIKRAPFVARTSQFALQNGFLTQVNSSKPSEVLAAVKIPADIVTYIASIPANLIQLKIDYSSANQKLLDQQKNTLSSYENLLNAQQQFIASLKTNQAPSSAANK